VDADLFALLVRCRDLHGRTAGAFDITSTPLSRCWGFLRREGRLPSPEAIDAARAMVGMPGVVFDETARTVHFARAGMELNLGSIG
jgi:thiamine biosynthesis lipoprotein